MKRFYRVKLIDDKVLDKDMNEYIKIQIEKGWFDYDLVKEEYEK